MTYLPRFTGDLPTAARPICPGCGEVGVHSTIDACLACVQAAVRVARAIALAPRAVQQRWRRRRVEQRRRARQRTRKAQAKIAARLATAP